MTVVIPTIHNAVEELQQSLESIIACKPYELILVTTANKAQRLRKLAGTLKHGCGFHNIRVLCTPIANKRLQVCEALPEVATSIIIMATTTSPGPPRSSRGSWRPLRIPGSAASARASA